MLTGLALISELAFAPTYVTAAALGGLGMFECLITVVEMLLTATSSINALRS